VLRAAALPGMAGIRVATFLGSGPLSARACPDIGTWSGFPRGTSGDIQTVFELTDEADPIPGLNEVTSTSRANPSTEGCASDVGCTIPTFSDVGVLASSRAVQPSTQTVQAYVHDVIGHGVLGLCHIDGNLIGGPELSLMSGGEGIFSGEIAGELTMLDIESAILVYASSLQLGAVRSDFAQEGLVSP